MRNADSAQNLAHLRAAADAVRHAFPITTWRKQKGPGPDELSLNGAGIFEGFQIAPGSGDLHLTSELLLPASVAGVQIVGDPLYATLFSIYPVRFAHGGRALVEASDLAVAPGPALITVLPRISEGTNGRVEIAVSIPSHQTVNWFNLKFTTPGLQARFEELDIAWSQLASAAAVAESDAERAIVASAAAMVPDIISPSATMTSILSTFADRLAPFREKIAALTVHLIGHSHIDLNWLWNWDHAQAVIRRDFRSILAIMRDYPELTFTHSQPASYELIREKEPDLFRQVISHIESGRWEAASLQWVEGDVNMAGGEAQVRQLLAGVRYSRDILHTRPSTFLAPDTFGHAGNVPQLAVSAGAVGYYHHRANPGGSNLWPAYWWEGQDGTRILAFSTSSYNGDITAGDITIASIHALRSGLKSSIHFHGIGDHGGGPARHNLDALRRFQKTPGLPVSRCSTTAAYVQEIIDSRAVLPVHRGETRTIFEGCYTTHADTKKYNRCGENMLITADTLAALAGLDRRAVLDAAWAKILFNQFHDVLDGSSIHEVYDDGAADFAQVRQAAQAVTHAALDVLEADITHGDIAVTNALDHAREDIVVVSDLVGSGAVALTAGDGHSTIGQYTNDGLVFIARVPAFSTVAYSIDATVPNHETHPISAMPAFSPNDGRADGVSQKSEGEPRYLRIDTPYFCCYVRRDCGVIVSLVDKRVDRELVAFGMRRKSDYLDCSRPELGLNVFQILDEYPHGMSAWQMAEIHTEHSLIRGATVDMVESGPVRCVLEVKHAFRSSEMRQRITFYHELARIDFQASVDWRELGSAVGGVPNLKVSFTARLDECHAWYETPFGAARRPADGQEVPALRWADVGGSDYGIAILNDGKYGHDALGCRLRLTLLRSGYEPDAISDVGYHDIRFSFVPHPGDWRDADIVNAAAGFSQPLLARVLENGRKPNSKRRAICPPIIGATSSVRIACLKTPAEGPGTIVRMYESEGRACHVHLEGIPPDTEVVELSIVEDRIKIASRTANSRRIDFTPWQVRTLRISRGHA